MRLLLMVAVLLGGLAGAARPALALDPADRQAIRQAIEGQLDAFRRDDAAGAFAFAAPAIREMFGTPENFVRMVKASYMAVYRARDVEFRDLVEVEEVPVQQVLVTGPDNRPTIALYTMERQSDGSWRIGGCALVASRERAI